jgi:hypothetical protein
LSGFHQALTHSQSLFPGIKPDFKNGGGVIDLCDHLRELTLLSESRLRLWAELTLRSSRFGLVEQRNINLSNLDHWENSFLEPHTALAANEIHSRAVLGEMIVYAYLGSTIRESRRDCSAGMDRRIQGLERKRRLG